MRASLLLLLILALPARGQVVDTPWGRFERTPGAVRGPFGEIGLERDAAGRRARVRFPSGVVTALRRDPRGRVAAVEHRHPTRGLVAGRAREVDAEGLVVDRRDPDLWVLDHGGGRRTVERPGGVVETWITDRAGRLVAAGDLRLRHVDGRVVEVEGLGRDPATHFLWDGAGRLRRVVRQGPDGALAVDYTWGQDGALAERRDEEGTARVVDATLVRAVLGPGRRVRVDVLDPEGGAPLATLGPRGWLFLHDDGEGTLLAVTDAAGAPAGEVALSPRGEVLRDPGPDVPLFWRGAELDRATGLALVPGRPYAPALGRFLAPDPARRGAAAYTPGLVGALAR